MTRHPKVIATNGQGKRTLSHMNFTRTLSDAPIVEPRHANGIPLPRLVTKAKYAGSPK